MNIILDSREHKLKPLLSATVKQLDVGDIWIAEKESSEDPLTENLLTENPLTENPLTENSPTENSPTDNFKPVWIIERKTADDLSSSIRDSRSREQRARLLNYASENNIKVMYLIEGLYKSRRYGVPRSTLLSALTNLIERDNCFVWFTPGVKESAEFITLLSKKVLEFKKESSNNSTLVFSGMNSNEYLQLHLKKGDNKTPKNCYLLQLATIPRSSIKVAKVIEKVYPNFCALIHAFEQSNSPEKLLADLVMELDTKNKDGTVKTRRIGDSLAKQIYTFLMFSHSETN